MKILPNNVEKWGPIFISILTLCVLLVICWVYDSRNSYLLGRLEEHSKKEEKYWQLIETYRLEVQALRVEMVRAGVKLPKGE